MAWRKRSNSHVIQKCWECTRLQGGMGKHICTWTLFFSLLFVCKCKVHLTWYALKRNPEEMSCLHFDCQTVWQICVLLQNANILRYIGWLSPSISLPLLETVVISLMPFLLKYFFFTVWLLKGFHVGVLQILYTYVTALLDFHLWHTIKHAHTWWCVVHCSVLQIK